MQKKYFYYFFIFFYDNFCSGDSFFELSHAYLYTCEKKDCLSQNVLFHTDGILKYISKFELVHVFFEQNYYKNKSLIDKYIHNSGERKAHIFSLVETDIYELLNIDILFLQNNKNFEIENNIMFNIIMSWCANIIENGRLFRIMQLERFMCLESLTDKQNKDRIMHLKIEKADNLLLYSLPRKLYHLIVKNFKEVKLKDLDKIKKKLKIKRNSCCVNYYSI